jgi:hypothetical protein
MRQGSDQSSAKHQGPTGLAIKNDPQIPRTTLPAAPDGPGRAIFQTADLAYPLFQSVRMEAIGEPLGFLVATDPQLQWVLIGLVLVLLSLGLGIGLGMLTLIRAIFRRLRARRP